MILKKLMAIMLAGTMVFGLTACGGGSSAGSTGSDSGSASSGAAAEDDGAAAGDDGAAADTASSSGEKLVVWTLAADLEQFAEPAFPPVSALSQNPVRK